MVRRIFLHRIIYSRISEKQAIDHEFKLVGFFLCFVYSHLQNCTFNQKPPFLTSQLRATKSTIQTGILYKHIPCTTLKEVHNKSIKKQDRQLNAPYTCRIKDKILEIGQRMKIYKKRNGRKEEKNSCTERQMSWNMTSDNEIHQTS